MNGKSDESLDQWVRQSLDRLPDAPPPGTTFDAGRLWDQLHPELQKTPAHRRSGWIGWAAAACTAGILLGWFWLNQQPDSVRRTVSSIKRPTVPMAIRPEQHTAARTDQSEPIYPAKIRLSTSLDGWHSKGIVKALPTVLPANESTQLVDTATELPTIADTESTMATQPEPVAITAIATPKRRFRIVHLNELQAEEAIRPTPYRTDHFVRLGTGDNGQPAPETAHPSIMWPLTNKSNQ